VDTRDTTNVWAGEAISGIVIGSDSTIYIGSSYDRPDSTVQRSVFYAINYDGSIKWLYWDNDTDYEMWRSPLVTDENKVLFATRSFIYSMNSDGTLYWKKQVGFAPSEMNIGMDGTIYFIDADGKLYALNSDGSIRWIKEQDDLFYGYASGGMSLSPDGNTIYVLGERGFPQIYAINTAGDIIWYYHDTEIIGSIGQKRGTAIPIVDNDGNVYLSNGNELLSFTADGDIRWRNGYAVSIFDQYTLDINGHIIVGSQSVHSIDYSGNVFWSVESPIYILSPIISDINGMVYGSGSAVISFNSNDGVINWEYQVDYPLPVLRCPVIGFGGFLFQAYPDHESKDILAFQ